MRAGACQLLAGPGTSRNISSIASPETGAQLVTARRGWREITLRPAGESLSVHLGVAELQFATAAAAQSFAQPAKNNPRYLAASKILTRYVVLQTRAQRWSSIRKAMRVPKSARFLDGVAKSGAKLWQSRGQSEPARH